MRLDYTLYGLAIIFFVVAAVSLVVVSDQTGKMLLTVSTAVIGLVSVSTGIMLKPKVQTVVSTSAPAVTQEASVEQPTVAEPAVDTPVIEAPPETASVVEAPVIESPIAVVAPQAEAPTVEAPVVSDAVAEVPVEVPAPVVLAEVPAPTGEVLSVAPISAAPFLDLTQVKGIGEKRAVQLKTYGITSLDDLAKADAADLAAKLKVSPKIVAKWITGAKELTK